MSELQRELEGLRARLEALEPLIRTAETGAKRVQALSQEIPAAEARLKETEEAQAEREKEIAALEVRQTEAGRQAEELSRSLLFESRQEAEAKQRELEQTRTALLREIQNTQERHRRSREETVLLQGKVTQMRASSDSMTGCPGMRCSWQRKSSGTHRKRNWIDNSRRSASAVIPTG